MAGRMEWIAERNRRMASGTGLVLALLVAVAGGAQAAEWNARASITERYNYDSNSNLSTGAQQEVWGFSTLPTFTLEGRTPRLEMTLNAGLEYSFFEGADNLDSFDQRGNAVLGYNWQRARMNLSGSVVHATTRTTELEDTGRDFSDAERLIFSGGGGWSYSVSPRDRLGIRGNASRSVAESGAIEDYSTYGGSMFWSRKLTEKDSFELNGAYSRFIRTSGPNLESDSVNGRLSYGHEFSPTFKVNVHGGGRYVMTESQELDGFTLVSRDENSAGVLAGASVTYLMARGEFNGAYERGVEESGAGRLQERDSIRISTNYKATPNISLDVTGTFIMQESVDKSVNDGRTFVSAEPGVSWQFLRSLYLRVSYRFKTQTFENLNGWAVSHGTMASLAWRMPAKNVVAGK